jgi:hypothetical protein
VKRQARAERQHAAARRRANEGRSLRACKA